jgi:branched-chain amino acid transport system substrate-binding protein
MQRSFLGQLTAGIITLAITSTVRADILIGVAGSLSGSNAWTGEQLQQGAEMAVRDINASGGVLGENVKLVIADDVCEGPQGVAVAEKLVGDGVVFVAGHLCSAASIPASEVYHRAGIIQISPASTNPLLTELGRDNVFRVCGRDDQQGVIAGDYLADHFARDKIAIVHDGSTYGKGLAEETKKQLHKRGLTEVLFEAVEPGQSDYSDLVAKLGAVDASVLYFGGYVTEAALILRTAREAGVEVQLVSGDGLATDQFLQIAGPAGKGTIFTFFPDPRPRPAAADVVKRFREEGYEPEGVTLFNYAAVQVWAQAVDKAGTVESDKVIGVLHSNKFATVLGSISFDAKGDVEQPAFDWYIWKEAGYEPLK